MIEIRVGKNTDPRYVKWHAGGLVLKFCPWADYIAV